jgi:hypothetical protein
MFGPDEHSMADYARQAAGEGIDDVLARLKFASGGESI